MEEAFKRKFYMQEIKRLGELLQNENELNNLDHFEADEYSKLLDSNFLKIWLNHSDMVCNKDASESHLKQWNAEYVDIEKIYILLKAKLRNQSEKFVPKANSTSSEIQERPKLEITWNKFSGVYEEWFAFYTKFW